MWRGRRHLWMEAGLVEEALALLRRALRAAQGKGRSGPVKPGESRAARVPWREVQAEPRAAGRCTSTGGQKKRTSAADAPDGGCGATGLAPGAAAPS
ncbi:hypothetical protein NDU88_005224 [Pleurodeles waltl]|uniref:Uncharacterized protein n=1 Tax=Pleurodeles waltl TaxID=8319 RepID=A0AAV7T9Z4_PLEWA|nr:hypothetical protein NDU88_005224 [Pleurodeles waltl]